MTKPDIDSSWYPVKVRNYKIIGDYETADVSFTWACDGPMYHIFGICWTRKCFRKGGDYWRSVVDGSIADASRFSNINYLIKEIQDKEKASQLADDFMEDMTKYISSRKELKDARGN
jgi:hypothetical protein